MVTWRDELREQILHTARPRLPDEVVHVNATIGPDGGAPDVFDAIESLGRVNRAEFCGAAPGTLLYIGGFTTGRQGEPFREAVHRFAYRLTPWNEGEVARFAASPARGSEPPYPAIDFDETFTEDAGSSWRKRPALA